MLGRSATEKNIRLLNWKNRRWKYYLPLYEIDFIRSCLFYKSLQTYCKLPDHSERYR